MALRILVAAGVTLPEARMTGVTHVLKLGSVAGWLQKDLEETDWEAAIGTSFGSLVTMQPAGNDQSTLEVKCMKLVSEGQVTNGRWDRHIMLPGGALDDEAGVDVKLFAMKAWTLENCRE
eukprot:5478695-Amphidinium_carterae.1